MYCINVKAVFLIVFSVQQSFQFDVEIYFFLVLYRDMLDLDISRALMICVKVWPLIAGSNEIMDKLT